MQTTEYKISHLVPEFERLWIDGLTSPEGLSSFIVLVLIGLTIAFTIISTVNYFRAKKQIKFYRNLLSGMSVEQLSEKRRDLVNKALENRRYGQLWKEFDESLVHPPKKERLCNTLDASHFFNSHTLAMGLTENRLLAAVPGFLTAIGVIGTFAGLQMGLSELNVTSAEFETLKIGIAGLIGGASVAFLTSVWGVLTSVLFNFYEKWLERHIRGSIREFQNTVDYLYPRITAEQTLSNIEDFSRQSTEKLAELDEKIGHRMQEVMAQASISISESVAASLNTILGPAIERIVDNAHTGSEKALDSLMGRFLDGVGSAGSSQREMLENASNSLSNATDGISSRLEEYSNMLESQFDVIVEKMGSQITQISNQSNETLRHVQSVLSQQLEDQQAREISRQTVINEQLNKSASVQNTLTNTIDSVIKDQKEQSSVSQAALKELLSEFKELSLNHKLISEALRTSTGDMKSSSNQLGLLSANIKLASENFVDRLQKAAEFSVQVSEQNSSSLNTINLLMNQVHDIKESFATTSNTLNQAAEKAEAGLSGVGGHFDKLTESLKVHVQDLETQIADLLNGYSERVKAQTNDRLNNWNQQTSSYITLMTDAVRTLSDVVDEIEGKVTLVN